MSDLDFGTLDNLEGEKLKHILGIDIGFGHVKVVLANDAGEIEQIFKFPSIIGVTAKNGHVSDNRIFNFKGSSWYVGDDCLNLPSSNIVDITEYKNLEAYAPLFLYKALKMLGFDNKNLPDHIVTGLSKAQLEQSGYFKAALENFVIDIDNGGVTEKMEFDLTGKISVLPQGAGSKLAIDKYGYDFPNQQTEFTGGATYVGVDIGFNTLDMFFVSNGKTSPNVFEGIEHEGVMKIASMVADKIKSRFEREISLHEAQSVLDTKVYKLRGQKHDMTADIQEIKQQYINDLLVLIENRYGKILDKCDFVFLSGGGSAFFNSSADNFFRVPKSHYEYYNVIGFALWGVIKF